MEMIVAKPAKPKEKRRNNEKRKERSRDAARCRRSREAEIFSQLAGALPLPRDAAAQLDKASVMRLAIAHLRVRTMMQLVPEIPQKSEKSDADKESVFLKALDGFLIVLSPEGDFVYLSENVSDYLGITQVDLIGQSVYDYSHPCDHGEVRDVLSNKDSDVSSSSFFLRLKCTLTSKGRNVNLKSASYKVIHMTGHMMVPKETDVVKEDQIVPQRCFVAIGQPIPHPSNIEIPLGKKTFLSKHSLDMKFIYADEKMADVLGYEPNDLVGKSVYDYYHAMDSDAICAGFKSLFSKGQCETQRFRFLAARGGYVWVVTQATLLRDKLHKPQSVLCVHHVVSGVESKDEIYSISQLESIKKEPVATAELKENIKIENQPTPVTISAFEVDTIKKVVVEDIDKSVPIRVPEIKVLEPEVGSKKFEGPQTATSKIFTPRTKEMNKGFLMFSDDEPGLTILKDEPDDLTHLAPTAGDVCVPLADSALFSEDMFDELMLSNDCCPLLQLHAGDPFMAYRDDDCDAASPSFSVTLSPNQTKSPGGCSVPSMCSPGDSLGDDDHISTFMSLQMDSEEEKDHKSPYIPTNVGDELPLLMSDDLMWGALPEDKVAKNNTKNTELYSSLAQLLCQSGITNAHAANTTKMNDHGGGLVNPAEVLGQIYPNNKSATDHWSLPNQLSKSPPTISISNHSIKKSNISSHTTERAQKRLHSNMYDSINKRIKSEPKERLSSELLNQLMSNTTTTTNQKSRLKSKTTDYPNKQTDKQSNQLSQPSDSVLMNLLEHQMGRHLNKLKMSNISNVSPDHAKYMARRQSLFRKSSVSLLDPEGVTIPSLMDLSEQDYEVNAPVNTTALLQGNELISALETPDRMS